MKNKNEFDIKKLDELRNFLIKNEVSQVSGLCFHFKDKKYLLEIGTFCDIHSLRIMSDKAPPETLIFEPFIDWKIFKKRVEEYFENL